MSRVVLSASLCGGMVTTLPHIARDVGSIPTFRCNVSHFYHIHDNTFGLWMIGSLVGIPTTLRQYNFIEKRLRRLGYRHSGMNLRTTF